MQEPVLKPVLASLLLFASFMTTAHSAEFNDIYAQDGDSIFAIEADPNHEVFYSQADEAHLPYENGARENYKVSLAGGQGAMIAPSWVLTSSQAVSWDEQKNPEKIALYFAGKGEVEYQGERVYRHPYKDLALVQLHTPVAEGREPVLLMMDALREGHGQIGIRKVVKGKEGEILALSGNSQDVIPDEGYENVGINIDGLPWVIESPLVGDVLIGVTGASQNAPQVAYARKWMQQIVDANTPDETLYWASFAQALPDHINSQPQDDLPEQTAVIEPERPSLIILQ